MSQSTLIPINQQGGGINDYLLPHEIEWFEMPNTARNVRILGSNKKPRPGYITVADLLAGGTKIQGLTFFDRSASSNDRLVGVYNKKIIILDPDVDAVWTQNAVAGITVDSEVYFAKWKDWLFAFDGVDKPGRWDGAAYTQPFIKPDSIADPNDFTPAFGAVWNNHLIVAGVPTAKNTAFMSKAASTIAPANIYDFSGALNTAEAAEILSTARFTAIRVMSDFAVLFDFTGAAVLKGFITLGADEVPDIAPVPGADGAISQGATVVVENDIYYLTPKREIKSISRGFATNVTTIISPVSQKIKNFMKNNLDPDQSHARSYYDRNNKLIKFHVKKVGSSFNDIVIVGDLKYPDAEGNPSWMIDDGKAFGHGVFYKNNNSYVVSDIIGQLYQDEIGLADDDDAPIHAIYDSKDFFTLAIHPYTMRHLDYPMVRKRYDNASFYGQITPTTELDISAFVDDVLASMVKINSAKIPDNDAGGIAVEGIGEDAIADDGEDAADFASDLFEFIERIPFRSTGRKIRFRFESNGINQNWIMSQYAFSFLPLGRFNVPVKEML